ncbi:MAG: Hsp20/alpha crystallin family protein [Patescibacteria group bacterium]|nr:Hsp20/alpha crystallin family protein [Patescibacteria group bacterium]
MPIKWQPFKNFEAPAPRVPDSFDNEEGIMPFSPLMPLPQMEEPAVDMYQDKNNLYLEMSLGGMRPENIEITIKSNVLTIKGASETKEKIKEENYLQKEIKKGAFCRVIRLPAEVQEKKAFAEAANGLLKITVLKAPKGMAEASKVPIKIK